jgi:uncharacterized protein DUF3500
MSKITKLVKTFVLFQICTIASECTSTLRANSPVYVSSASISNDKEIEKVVSLAKAFRSSLSVEQAKILQLGWSKADAAKWSNLPQSFSHPQRVGISFSQLDKMQIKAAKALLAFVLDDKTLNEGLDEAEGIQSADDVIGALPGKSESFASGNYYIAFLGEPSMTGIWELQFGGHHLAFSNTYKDGMLIGMTPSFRGVEPMTAFDANGRHYQPMEQERLAFKSILDGLTDNELNTARLSATFADILLGPGKDNSFPLQKQGIKVGLLSKNKQDLVLKAISLYVKDLKSTETDKILAAYTKELPDTYISYSGNKGLDKVGDYFRIDGPGVWIEYNTQAARDFPPTHPHSIWRDHKTDYGGQ